MPTLRIEMGRHPARLPVPGRATLSLVVFLPSVPEMMVHGESWSLASSSPVSPLRPVLGSPSRRAGRRQQAWGPSLWARPGRHRAETVLCSLGRLPGLHPTRASAEQQAHPGVYMLLLQHQELSCLNELTPLRQDADSDSDGVQGWHMTRYLKNSLTEAPRFLEMGATSFLWEGPRNAVGPGSPA